MVVCPDEVRETGRALFGAIATRGGEGLIAKRVDSAYQPGRRSPDWRKIKVRHEVEGKVLFDGRDIYAPDVDPVLAEDFTGLRSFQIAARG